MKERPLRDQIAGRCVHFTGIQHRACNAKVRYDLLGWPLPCMKTTDGGEVGQCVERRWPKAEEIAAEVAMYEDYTRKFLAVQSLVSQIKRDYQGQNWGGVVECPVCNGKLHLSHARYNGHVWGRCSTPGCLVWME